MFRLRATELLLPAGLMVCLLVILTPLPAAVLDLLLIGNIALSAIVLLTTIYVAAPLEFSVFPTVLLATTLGRLVLNVSTTRLILTDAASSGLNAAGGVIQSFGQFVAGDQVVVGVVLFCIIATIQFVVITKGATRISEVSARFALDGMPGKQMAVDADLQAGAIDEVEAHRRREEVSQQADFYGAMDGASKFVRGDAVAGVFITMINIVGGLAIGIFQYGMSPSEAVEVFTKLTIGDGLVSQIPALLISLAAGLLVTRSTQRANLPLMFLTQLLARPQVLAVAGVFLGLLLLTHLPATPLVLLGSGCVGASILVSRKQREQEQSAARAKVAKPAQPQKLEPRIEEYLSVDPVELELGRSLLHLADVRRGGSLLSRITQLRQTLATQLGLVLPKVRIRDNLRLEEDQYRIKINGNPVATSHLPSQMVAVLNHPESRAAVRGRPLRHAAYSQPLLLVAEEDLPTARAAGLVLVDPPTILLHHLQLLVKRHASELLTRDATRHLVEETRRSTPAVVEELIPELMKLADVQRILQRLLVEGVSIRQLSLILEALGDEATRTSSELERTELVRRRLARTICARFRDARDRLQVVTLDPALEERVQRAVQGTDREVMVRWSSAEAESFCRAIDRGLELLRQQERPEVLLVRPEIRPAVRQLTSAVLPDLTVLSYAEMTAETKVVSLGIVSDTEE